MSDPIYLDYNATTPVAPEVLEAMLPWLRELFGNASSSHAFGKRAAAAVAHAREQVADMIGAHADEIVFTGCATESNNVAVLGVAGAQDRTASPAPVGARSAAKRHIVISAIEHPAVMAPAISLRERGWRVTIVPVDVTGRIQIERLEEALGSDTALVPVMHAGAPAHLNLQMLAMRDRLHARLTAAIPGLLLNGHLDERLPNTLHVSFPGVSGRTLLADAADIVAASVGSACHSEYDAVSGVLAAMGFDAARAAGAVRLSVGRMTTEAEIDRAADGLVASWRRIG